MITDDPFVHGGSMTRFADRAVAGRLLAGRLADYRGRDDVVVLGLPRGGVPVAAEVARELEAPLDVCAVRKLGVPGFPELAMGAIAPGGVRVLNDDIVADVAERLGQEADEVVCVMMPHPFSSGGQWYDEFTQASDREVCGLLSPPVRQARANVVF